MKTLLRLSLILFPLALAPACDDDKDKDTSSKSDKDKDKDDDSDDDSNAGDDDQVPLWDCVCEAECDGDILSFEEEVCSDAETVDLAIDISVEACAVDLESDCVDFFCGCECDEDPDLACD